MVGSFTSDIDLIQVLLIAFGAFFAALVIYLRREDKREGYPLAPTTPGRTYKVIGWPAPPPPKTYRLMGGGTVTLPNRKPQVPLDEAGPPLGQPLRAVGTPELGLGAGAFVLRADAPVVTIDDKLLLEPLRTAHEWSVRRGETDPRGMRVLGRDYVRAGTVLDLWVDRVARHLRYLEVELDGVSEGAIAGGGGSVLVPIFECDIERRGRTVVVEALTAAQLHRVPRLADPDRMTAREEDRLTAFYAGGETYADAGRRR